MRIFISWSGDASRAVAELLRTYLPCVLQDLQPFVSSHDLGSGVRWAAQLSQELEQSSFGIICLTPGNIHSDWILFEAGALTKHVEGRACCLLLQGLGAADIAGPLAQFQNRLFDEPEFLKLITDLNACLPQPLPESSLHLVFKKWWPDIDRNVRRALSKAAHPTTSARREPIKILEELLLRVRSLQNVIEGGRTPLLFEAAAPESAKGDAANRASFRVIVGVGSSELPDPYFRLDPVVTFQSFLDDFYTKYLEGHVPQASYGVNWVLQDQETGDVIRHARMKADGTIEPGLRDHRSLVDVGIRPDGTLAVRIRGRHAAA